MAGHNKWSKIKRTKGVLDARRGKLFSRLSKEITVAAKAGGGDPDANARLRTAVLAARTENMPSDNIERAIKRGTGELQGVAIEEIVYEGYGPGGVAVLVEVATDNRNRAAQDVRAIFSKHNGSLAASGSVSYQFQRRGRIAVPRDRAAEDALLGLVIDAGAEEFSTDDEHYAIVTPVTQFTAVLDALRGAGVEPAEAALVYIPENTVAVGDEAAAARVLHLCEALEDNDDVQAVHANFEIPDDIMTRIAS